MSHSSKEGSVGRAEGSEIVAPHQRNLIFNPASSVIDYLKGVEPECLEYRIKQYFNQNALVPQRSVRYDKKRSTITFDKVALTRTIS